MKVLRLFSVVALSTTVLLCAGCKDDKEILPPADGDYTGVVLNEICGGAADDKDDDWVEIYNTNDSEIDLSGVQLVKIDEDDLSEILCAIPNGTRIAAKGYLVVAKKNGAFSAGISNTKKVSIVLNSPSGSIEIDRFDRDAELGADTGHVLGGSYSRIPDGTGVWTIVTECTRGEANKAPEAEPAPTPDPDAVKDYSGLVLNELNGNKPAKYIEICNTLDKPVDLTGVQLRKNDETPVIWIAPEGLSIEAGGRITLISDQPSNNTAAGFEGGLSAKKSLKIELLDPEGNLLDVFKNLNASGQEIWDDTPRYNGETNVESFGRYPDATGEWYMMEPTQGEENAQGNSAISMETSEPDPLPSEIYEGLVLNELNGNDPKYIELYNGSDEQMDITGVKLRKDNEEFVYTAPEGTVIPSKGFLKLLADQSDPANGFSSGLSAKKSVMIELFAPDGTTLIDVFKNQSQEKGDSWGESDPKYNGDENKMSYGRYPDGAAGKWYMTTPTAGTANARGSVEIVWQ